MAARPVSETPTIKANFATGVPWVPETFLARFPVSVKYFVASAFGQHRKFPPHARKTSGTQGTTGALRRSALLPDVFTQFTSEYFAHEKSSLDGC